MTSTEWQGKTVMITGGTRGVGRACADQLLVAGANVAVCARTQAHLDAMAADGASAERLLCVRADVGNAADLERFYKETVTRFGAGSVKGLVNNAGGAVVGAFMESTDDDWKKHLDVRLMATVRLSRIVARGMGANGGGSIVNIAGAAGADPTAFLAVAGVVNAGIINLSRMMADELADLRVRVNTVNPGTLDSDLGAEVLALYAGKMGLDTELLRDEMYSTMPLGRIPVPADVAHAVVFFLSERAGMITGSALTPDGGILIRRVRG